MEQLGNIASLPGMGFPDLPLMAAAESRGPQVLFVLPGTPAPQTLPAPPENGASAPAEAALPLDLQKLLFRISALLQKGGVWPDMAQNTIPEELAEKIAALLQGAAPPEDSIGIAPALTSDLAGGLSLQIQEDIPDAPDILPADNGDLPQNIAALLERAAPPAPEMTGNAADSAQIEEIAGQVLALKGNDTEASFDPALLQPLKEKLAALPFPGKGADNNILARIKPELVRFLQAQGLEQREIEHYLSSLARDLRSPEKPGLPFSVLPEMAAKTSAPAGNSAAPELLQSQAPDALPAGEDPATRQTTKPSLKKETAAPPPPPPAAPSAPQQQDASAKPPAPVQAGMVQLLAQKGDEAAFSKAGDGNSGQPQGFSLDAALLKTGGTESAHPRNFANYLTAARGAPSAAAQMVTLHLQRNIGAKISTMTLQLEPADLGRLDIRLKFDKEGGVKARLSVEKPETLALLQRDAHHLERALQQSGLDFDESALSFDLRRQGQQRDLEGFYADRGNAEEFAAHLGGGAEKALRAKIAVPAAGYVTQTGVNIMV